MMLRPRRLATAGSEEQSGFVATAWTEAPNLPLAGPDGECAWRVQAAAFEGVA